MPKLVIELIARYLVPSRAVRTAAARLLVLGSPPEIPTSHGVSVRFSMPKAMVRYFQAASGVAYGVDVARPEVKPGGVGSAGGRGDSETRTGSSRMALVAGLAVAVGVGDGRALGGAVGLASGAGDEQASTSINRSGGIRRTASAI